MGYSINGSLVRIDLDWPEFKQFIDGTKKKLLHQHVEDSEKYDIFAVDGPYFYSTTIFKDGATTTNLPVDNATWRADWEAECLSFSNRTVKPLDNTISPQLLTASAKRMDAVTKYFFSPDLADKSTWYYDAIKVTAEAVGTGNGVLDTFSLDCGGNAGDKVLEVYGKVTNALALAPSPQQINANSWGTPGDYLPKIYIDGVLQAQDRPFRAAGDRDYRIDSDTHLITFSTPPALNAEITATYWYVPHDAQGHLLKCVHPPTGKKWTIDYVESQFSANMEFNDTIVFGMYPKGIYAVPLAPELHYTNAHEVDDYTIKSNPVVPAWGGTVSARKCAQDKYVKHWEYVEELSVSSEAVLIPGLGAQYLELNARLEEGTVFSGEKVTITVRILEEDL